MSNGTGTGGGGGAVDADSGDLDWQALYETYAPLVRHHASRLVDASLVDDIVQETFLRAYRNRRSIRPDRPLGPWFSVIARRAAIDLVRRREVHDRVSGAVPVAPVPLEPIEDDYFNAVRRDGIRRVFAELNDRHRRVLAGAMLEPEPRGAGERRALDDTTRSVLARARRGFRERYVDLSRQTGVFGSAVAAVRRRSVSARDTIVRAEAWLQAGMPVLVVACAGFSVSGRTMEPGLASGTGLQAAADAIHEPHQVGTAVGRIGAVHFGDTTAVGFQHPRVEHHHRSGAEDSPEGPTAAMSTTVDWTLQRGDSTNGVFVDVRTRSIGHEYKTYSWLVFNCSGDDIVPTVRCRAWGEVPEDQRQHNAEVPNATAAAGLTR